MTAARDLFRFSNPWKIPRRVAVGLLAVLGGLASVAQEPESLLAAPATNAVPEAVAGETGPAAPELPPVPPPPAAIPTTPVTHAPPAAVTNGAPRIIRPPVVVPFLQPKPANLPANQITLGLNLARGNTEDFAVHAGLMRERATERTEQWYALEGHYGETTTTNAVGRRDSQTHLQNARAAAAVRRMYAEVNYLAWNLDVAHDKIAELDYRWVTGPSAGRYLLRDERRSLAVELGLVYLRERLGGRTAGRPALRTALRHQYAISETARLWASLEYIPGIESDVPFLVFSEAGCEALVTRRISLRVVLQDNYNSEPADDKRSNDLYLSAGLGYKF